MWGDKLALLTYSTSFYLSAILFLRVSISAKRTTIRAKCSLTLFCKEVSSEALNLISLVSISKSLFSLVNLSISSLKILFYILNDVTFSNNF